MKQAGAFGAKYCFGGVPAFYPAIGFETIAQREFWSKEESFECSAEHAAVLLNKWRTENIGNENIGIHVGFFYRPRGRLRHSYA